MNFYRIIFIAAAIFNFQGAYAASMLEAMQTAVDTNPEILAAKLERRSRQHEIYQAQSGYYPDVALAAGVGRETTQSPATGDESVSLTRHERSINARLGLFEGFATASEVDRQKAREKSAKYNADSVVEKTALEAAKAYVEVLRQQALLDLTRASLANHQSIYDQMKSRLDSGVGSRSDLDQITGRLALANTNVVTTESNFLNACHNYERVIGQYPDVQSMNYPGDLALQLPATEDDLVKTVVENNPVLQMAQADVSAATAQHEAAKSPLYPRLSLEAEKNYDKDIGGVVGDDQTTLVALRLRYDLFSGGKDTERKKQTADLMMEADELRKDTYRKITQSAHLSWNAYQSVVRQLPYLESYAQASSETKKAYGLQFNVGRRTLLDLLNTENEEVEARKTLLAGRHDLVLTQLEVLSVMGKLLQSVALTQKPEPEIKNFYGVKSELFGEKQVNDKKSSGQKAGESQPIAEQTLDVAPVSQQDPVVQQPAPEAASTQPAVQTDTNSPTASTDTSVVGQDVSKQDAPEVKATDTQQNVEVKQ